MTDDNNNNNNNTVIFHGAGTYPERNFTRWLSGGLHPACFTDADEKKHYQRFSSGALEILPLDEAAVRYPEAVFYITVSHENMTSVYEYLRSKGIPGERIKHADGLVEYRKGCANIGEVIHYHYDWIAACCTKYRKIIFHKGTFADAHEVYRTYCEALLGDLRAGNQVHCDGCQSLVNGWWPVMPQVRYIGLDTGFPDDRCNFKCVYCQPMANFAQRKQGAHGLYEVLKEIEILYGGAALQLGLGAGEIMVRPEIDKILDCIVGKPWHVDLYTNGSVVHEGVMGLVRAGKMTRINISIDAGTRETYAKVKGVDCFEKVVRNIEKYVGAGAPVDLKYILLRGVNDNEADIDGFIELAARFKTTVCAAHNLNDTSSPLPMHSRAMLMRLIEGCKKNNLNIIDFNFQFFFHEDDLKIAHTLIGS